MLVFFPFCWCGFVFCWCVFSLKNPHQQPENPHQQPTPATPTPENTYTLKRGPSIHIRLSFPEERGGETMDGPRAQNIIYIGACIARTCCDQRKEREKRKLRGFHRSRLNELTPNTEPQSDINQGGRHLFTWAGARAYRKMQSW